MFTAFRCSTGDCTAEADQKTQTSLVRELFAVFFSGEMWITKTPVDDAFQKKTEKKTHGKSGVKKPTAKPQLDVNGCQMSCNLADSRMVAPLQHY